ncbi:Bug family tripartite tricarboxylate transporter substrate binding protein [Pigmentiphaga litoralis]|uniref:Tripartite-type tricarboxylate transporter receptor subunit TctC n=1 Tax=Pigmentiphaga litoralis TaxID=516702 RepID=A0A7Y9IYH5_9BURK|nr:tripartite tricarboxylate transporter substrate-binding protein [Pigmentiphaga litoralis]NYE26194.1 tripartite-type tricarboxylate transporter receptor subunit TctC [Pigmentiphaga litoralis]NYE85314.1 tripartite-type tricarboxylate transporter receptor subunit TctC [Pigmentiphaga litoralis]
MPTSFPAPPNRGRRTLLKGVATGVATSVATRVATGAAITAALTTPFRAAVAQGTYPSQPIRVIVPFGPGGLADISMRLIGQKLGERLGHPIIVDNRPGAGGVVAATSTLGAPKDGHTLILFTNGTAIGKSLFNLKYDPEKDFTPISTLAYFDLILLTKKDGPITDLQALLAAGKTRRLTLGTINPGSTQNLSGELFKSVAKLNADLVPYKSTSEVLAALMRGDVDVAFESYAALKGAVDAGQVSVIAATGPTRSSWLPKVPTVREAGLPGYEVTGWNALYAPAGVPAAVVETLNRHMREVLALPDVRQRLLDLGTDPKPSSPAELAEVFCRDTQKWAAVIRQAGIKPQ